MEENKNTNDNILDSQAEIKADTIQDNEEQATGTTQADTSNSNPRNKNVKVSSFKELKVAGRLLLRYVGGLVNIADDTDPHTTIANIEKGVEFKGDNIWVLFFAIIIASVGLNVNSTAVIIGAMLVSPLMGPIMGLGLAIGINNGELLKKSLKNFGIMVVISIIASSVYFLISPLGDAQSELLARTQPTIFDVFIAFFGGLAGILASSRKQEKVTIVSGVAIATALMPPLCTVGYGIGTGQIMYSLGALYLFFINSFFIALATFLMVRYLKFPPKKFLDVEREKKVKRMISVFAIIVIVPSVFIAFDVIKETSFNSSAIAFVKDIENSPIFAETQIVTQNRKYSRKESTIFLSVVGKEITPEKEEELVRRMKSFGLDETKLEIKQAAAGTLDINTQAEVLQSFIEHKDSTIASLTLLLEKAKANAAIKPEQLAKEVSVLFPNVKSISLSKTTNKVNVQTLREDVFPTIVVEWIIEKDDQEIFNFESWMKVRLGEDDIDITHRFVETVTSA